jgi:hypothetical protein
VLVRNRGVDPIELTGARVGSGLRNGARAIGVEIRPGFFPTVDDTWPSPRHAYVPVQGYVVTPGRKATIAFGFDLPLRGVWRMGDVRIAYRENDHEHELRVGPTARLCVGLSRPGC